MRKCTIIAGFAGIGKTTVAKKYKNVYDIKMREYDILFVKSHPDILEVCDEENIPYIICYPCKEDLEVYKQRYRDRGNSPEYIEKTINSYDFKVQRWSEKSAKRIVLRHNEMLETYLLNNVYDLIERQ